METTESQHGIDSAPIHRTMGAFIGLYVVGVVVGFVLMVMFWGNFYFVSVFDSRVYSYSAYLIVCIALICVRRTRPFALGLLTAEFVFWAMIIGFFIWLVRFWNPYSMHF